MNRADQRKAQTVATLTRWAEGQPLVRAMLLTSSFAIPAGPVDLLSDYDVILALLDVRPYHDDRSWLEAFGPVLALYHDPLEAYLGLEKSGYVTQYESGLKIDFTLWPVETLRRIAAQPQLSEELDAGYEVLLDKDGLTQGLPPPTYRGYIPAPPTEAQYQATIESFFLDATYVAKYLWRDDLVAAKHILDHAMKQDGLRPMLEWLIELDHQWAVKPGPYGRRLKQWLRPDLWAELERTYTGADPEQNREALYRVIALHRRVAVEVGERLGYRYPHDLERRVLAYLRKVEKLEREAEEFE